MMCVDVRFANVDGADAQLMCVLNAQTGRLFTMRCVLMCVDVRFDNVD